MGEGQHGLQSSGKAEPRQNEFALYEGGKPKADKGDLDTYPELERDAPPEGDDGEPPE